VWPPALKITCTPVVRDGTVRIVEITVQLRTAFGAADPGDARAHEGTHMRGFRADIRVRPTIDQCNHIHAAVRREAATR